MKRVRPWQKPYTIRGPDTCTSGNVLIDAEKVETNHKATFLLLEGMEWVDVCITEDSMAATAFAIFQQRYQIAVKVIPLITIFTSWYRFYMLHINEHPVNDGRN